MLAKLLRSSVSRTSSLKQQARLREIREYMCIREAMDKQASEKAAADYKALLEKHKITSTQLSELFSILGSDYNNLHKYFDVTRVAQEKEQVQEIWRNSSFFRPDTTFKESFESLKAKYSDILLFHESQALRRQAMDEVAVIFSTGIRGFSPGYIPNTNFNTIDKLLVAHAAALRKQGPKLATSDSHIGPATQKDLNEQAIVVLHTIFKSFIADPDQTFSEMVRHFQVYYPSGSRQIAKLGYTMTPAERQQLVDWQKDSELETLLSDVNSLRLTPNSYTNGPWIDEKKVIFEAFTESSNDWRLYNLIAILCLAGVIYKVYQGDATIVQYLLLLGVFGYTRNTGRIAKLRYTTPYLNQINLHKSGQHIDLIINHAGKFQTVENVKIADFKIHRSNVKIGDADYNKLLKYKELGAWYATWGNKFCFVPFEHRGSTSILENVFGGRALPQKLLQ